MDDSNNKRIIRLDKENKRSFGICIVKGEQNRQSGIFIKDIVPQSPAYMCGKLKVGDQILSLNDRDIRNATEQIVIELIKNAGKVINLEIRPNDSIKEIYKPSALKRQPTQTKAEEQNGMNNNNNNNNNDSNVQEDNISDKFDPSFYDDEDENMNLTGRMLSSSGYEIDRASAANANLSETEKAASNEKEDVFGYTNFKIKKRYGKLGKIVKATFERQDNEDIGLAFAGHKDRQKMACFIAGINPVGPCKKADLQVGDEVLEMNGNVLKDRCHLNVSCVYKTIPGNTITFIVLRRSNYSSVMSVKPVTKFSEAVDETKWLFTAYKNVRKVQIRKTGVCIGIMVIAGKHVEVGNGIFISDLQEGSVAQEAGLKVGEMILAINKDILVETSYDTAVGIIKRSKGVINFVIANLKSEEQLKKEKEAEEKKKIEQEKKEKIKAEPEKPKDPLTCEIFSNTKTGIEIKTEKKPLGVIVVGGKNNYVTTGVVITHIYPDGMFAKDNRLEIFDQILEINGINLNFEQLRPGGYNSTLKVHQHFNLPYEKVNMQVYRASPIETETITVEVAKKPGKDFGISLAYNVRGAVITDMYPGGYPEIDTKLQRGDIINKINDTELENTSLEVCYSLLKAATGKVTLQVVRPKPNERK
ncbi:inactivation-no-after-potential D protein isoform X2 [Condylostylus longicornis]|uniref:inactivation-no-after-potential D protein isoform X2 n=1 Tax=Condylostylus longicornis TaxID=2530218 RepID=UPI00244E448F|nr:inactivation-no-after-potential D protein isoform X2 [Condylostylus longicornis]